MSKKDNVKNGLFIEDLILYSDLTVNEKFLLSDIYLMCKNGEFEYFKLNQTIADMMRITVKSVSRILNSLESRNLIVRVMKRPYLDSIKTQRNIIPVYSSIKKLETNNNSPRKNK